ncbi:Mrp/NBP35 family ATP-binding protein [Aurantibacillus circumpalustris]|uniref:Mrp/NBP35 family ATP-binding protein n=1 Tax=Aurantibacillus circumpalustris TaxID=3036359 RepID=UPI00295BEAEB|nr:Mrp/NBP35 family ATP-binding protein [Aurantibacillus circumpalustris]
MEITIQKVLDALKYVDDPDLKKDLVTLNMIKDVAVDGKNISFTVVLTTPACPMKDMIHNACMNAILHYVDKEAKVKINMTATVTTKKGKDETTLRDVKNIIAVASGKGGVGKSTIAANLAVGLARQGAKVGLVDADIYGPSQHIMFGMQNEGPGSAEFNGQKKMAPVVSHGVKLNSIGFLAGPNQPIALRGPMATKALSQLFYETVWGELDYLIVDLPPGTGDIQISLCSQVPVTGAVVVCTPQDVAISDARKGIALFQLEQVNVPILGLVENMAWFTPEELPENKYYIFGKDGVKHLAEELNVPLICQLPLVQSVREASDAGRPAVMQENTVQALAFMEMAQNVAQQVAIRNADLVEA